MEGSMDAWGGVTAATTACAILKGRLVDKAALRCHLSSKKPVHSILKRPSSASSCHSVASLEPPAANPVATPAATHDSEATLHDSVSSTASGGLAVGAIRVHDRVSDPAAHDTSGGVRRHEQQEQNPTVHARVPGPSNSGSESANWVSPASAPSLTRNLSSNATTGGTATSGNAHMGTPSRLGGGATRASRYLVIAAATGAATGVAPCREECRRQYASWSGVENGAAAAGAGAAEAAAAWRPYGAASGSGARGVSSGPVAPSAAVHEHAAAGAEAVAVAATAAGQLPGTPSRHSQEMPGVSGGLSLEAPQGEPELSYGQGKRPLPPMVESAVGGDGGAARCDEHCADGPRGRGGGSGERWMDGGSGGGGIGGGRGEGPACSVVAPGGSRGGGGAGRRRGRCASVDAAAYAAVLPDHVEEIADTERQLGLIMAGELGDTSHGALSHRRLSRGSISTMGVGAGEAADGAIAAGSRGGGGAEESLAFTSGLPSMRLRARSLASSLAAEVEYDEGRNSLSAPRANERPRARSDSGAISGSGSSGRWLGALRLIVHALFPRGSTDASVGGSVRGSSGGSAASPSSGARVCAAAELRPAAGQPPTSQPPTPSGDDGGSGGGSNASRSLAARLRDSVLTSMRRRDGDNGSSPAAGGGAWDGVRVDRSRDSVMLYRKRLGMEGERPVGLLRYLASNAASSSASSAAAAAPQPPQCSTGSTPAAAAAAAGAAASGKRKGVKGARVTVGNDGTTAAAAAAARKWVELDALGAPEPLFQRGQRSVAVLRESRAAEALATGLTALRASVAVMEMEAMLSSDDGSAVSLLAAASGAGPRLIKAGVQGQLEQRPKTGPGSQQLEGGVGSGDSGVA